MSQSRDAKQENVAKWIVAIGGAVILLVFLFHLFIPPAGYDPNATDNNKNTLYSRVHPMHLEDIVGVILFIIGVLWITGVLLLISDKTRNAKLKAALGERYNPAHSYKWVAISGAVILVGFLLFWV